MEGRKSQLDDGRGDAAMKLEAWIFGDCSIFLLVVTPVYWFSTSTSGWTGETPTGPAPARW